MNLQQYGLQNFFEQQIDDSNKYILGRVTLEHKHSYRIVTEQNEWLGTISGKMAFESFARKDYPAVGDWVLVEQMPGEEKCLIHKILERKSVFSRKMAGLELDEQIVAVNVDIIMLVTSLNDDFNERRLERYLTAAWNSGATPIIVLTKADLCENVDEYVEKVQNVAFGVDVYPVSTFTGDGLSTVKELFRPNKSIALMGSSGVGKSTLTNALIEEEKMVVHTIREDDAKGRHTTTHRELFALEGGGVIIDTPGMRELQLWSTDSALDTSFSDIQALLLQCKFRNCSHKKEPGCAIQNAIACGDLEQQRYDSYIKLQREIAYLNRKADLQATLIENRKNKKLSKQNRK
ncbi:ribosome small subunit-dependent GTPase A [Kurthia zopfii]|uniref:ribosome small subunit-dependent GTPase A n=1 Tax=Kurthia zopfii TaxID=1650 RepID=UPI000F6EAB24|nr:ribosome small subunit-dependent GTPase A [Kurthia zopfii]VEI05950.1 Putative ribosome biogenesis GTPase RsgA [Kurthia zopfii]